jgi:peptide chain release factor 2
VVTCQNERSQHQNREVAMKILMSRLIDLAEQQHKEDLAEIKGDFSQITWGSQIRSYVFQPYTMVKDHRTGFEVGNIDDVMNGNLEGFVTSYLKMQ